MQTEVTTESIQAELTEALGPVQRAHAVYQRVALAVVEKTATPKELAKAATDLRDAEQRVAALTAAKAAHDARTARNAAAALAAQEAAEAELLRVRLEAARRAAEAWDSALMVLAAATNDYDAATREVYLSRPDSGTVRKLESAKHVMLQVVGFHLYKCAGEEHRPLGFAEEQARLTYYLPPLPVAAE